MKDKKLKLAYRRTTCIKMLFFCLKKFNPRLRNMTSFEFSWTQSFLDFLIYISVHYFSIQASQRVQWLKKNGIIKRSFKGSLKHSNKIYARSCTCAKSYIYIANAHISIVGRDIRINSCVQIIRLKNFTYILFTDSSYFKRTISFCMGVKLKCFYPAHRSYDLTIRFLSLLLLHAHSQRT